MRRTLSLLHCTLLLLAVLFVVTKATSSSGSIDVGDNSGDRAVPTVDVNDVDAFQPAGDFGHKPASDDGEVKTTTSSPSGQEGSTLSSVTIAIIVTVTTAAVVVAVGMMVYAWRAAIRADEGQYMDLGDERNYDYGRFGDYAAM